MSEEELTKAMEGLGMDEGDGEGTIQNRVIRAQINASEFLRAHQVATT